MKAKTLLYELCCVCTQADQSSLIWMRNEDRDASGCALPVQRGKAEPARADSPTRLLLAREPLFSGSWTSGERGRAAGTRTGVHGTHPVPLPQREAGKSTRPRHHHASLGQDICHWRMLYIRKINILRYISHKHDAKCLINSRNLDHCNWLPGSRMINKQNETYLTSLLLVTPLWAIHPQLPCCADLPEISRLGKFFSPLYGN